jgi:hypothetical protein
MGQGARVKDVRSGSDCRRWFGVMILLAVGLFGGVLAWSSNAAAGPAGGITGDPKRSYGAIDVIMYQTSW